MSDKIKYDKSYGNLKRPNTVSYRHSNTHKKRTDPEEKDRHSSPRIKKNSFFIQSKNDSFVQEDNSVYDKHHKQLPNKKKKGSIECNYQADFVPTAEIMPVISMAAFAQDEIIQMLRIAKEEFLNKISKEGKSLVITNGMNVCQSSSPLPLVKGIKESRDSYCLADSCNNNLDEILHVWIHLFYFIINIKINLIRILKAAGEDALKPNAGAEMDILTQAIECVKFFSILKLKLLSGSLEELQFFDDSKKRGKEIRGNEDCVLSSFLSEMEFLGKRVKEIIFQKKKTNRTLTMS